MNLKEITQFNPALIYCLDPEASSRFRDPSTVEYLFHGIEQYHDMFNAYLYAQNTVLATITKIGIGNITAEQILEWLNQLHLRIATALAIDMNTKAGEFSKRQVFRWNPSYLVHGILYCHLIGQFDTPEGFAALLSGNILDTEIYDQAKEILKKNYKLDEKISSKEITIAILEAMSVQKEAASTLLDLVDRLHQDKTISIPQEQQTFIDTDPEYLRPAITTLSKLAILYHENKLTAEEKLRIRQVVKFCILPSQYSEVMKKFAEDLLKSWQSCNPADLDKVAALVSETYYNITEIHPYFNGNGRLATCFMNIILRSLGKPSILMRYSSEKKDPNSSYSKAISTIDANSDLLLQHIKSRIKDTEEKGDYADQSLRDLINARVNLSNVAKEVINLFPDYNINATLVEIFQKVPANTRNDEINIYALKCVNFGITHLEEKLKELKQPPKKIIIVPQVVQRKYVDDEITIILKKLETLTNRSGWKSYKSNGLTILLNLDDNKIAKRLIIALNKTNALQAKLMQTPEDKKPVVLINSIKLEKLIAIESLDVNDIDIKNSKLEEIKPSTR